MTKPGRSRDQTSRSRDWSHDNRRGHMTFPTFFTHRHIASCDRSVPSPILLAKVITPVEVAPGILTVPVKVGLALGAQLLS